MRFLAKSGLGRRSESELGALLAAWNQALAGAKPLSAEWHDAVLSVENILNERSSRLSRPALRPF
jgi:hypothetical protein